MVFVFIYLESNITAKNTATEKSQYYSVSTSVIKRKANKIKNLMRVKHQV